MRSDDYSHAGVAKSLSSLKKPFTLVFEAGFLNPKWEGHGNFEERDRVRANAIRLKDEGGNKEKTR
jgi:hypothetical protein